MNYYNIPTISGVVKDYHPRLIADGKASDASNVIFENGRIKNRWGYLSLGNNLPLNGEVMALINYELLSTSTKYIVALTTRDGYKYNTATGNWDYITEKHITGTAGCSGSTGVTGVASEWDTNWVANVMELKFGTQDINGTGSPDTWYTVASFDSATGLTLDENGPSTTAVNYVLRKCWSGDIDNEMDYAMPYDGTTADKILVVANGIENLKFWAGSNEFQRLGYFADATASTTTGSAIVTHTDNDTCDRIVAGMTLSGSGIPASTTVDSVDSATQYTMSANATATATGVDVSYTGNFDIAKYVDYFGSVSLEHLILSNITASAIDIPQRIDVTNASAVEVWHGTYYDFVMTNDAIKGIKSLGSRMIVYKEYSITELWADPGGGNDDPFNFEENKISDKGTVSIRTVADFGNYHIFLGSDTKLYKFDGINAVPIGVEITNDLTKNIDHDYLDKCFAFRIAHENLYCLFIPTVSDGTGYPARTYVYNYMENTWSVWEFTDTMTAMGIYKKEYAPTWAELEAAGTLWSEMGMRWSDLIAYEDRDRYLLGDSSGNVYEFEKTWYDDNGTDVTFDVTTKDYPINDPKHTIRILELALGIQKVEDPNGDPITSTVRVRASINAGADWSDWVSVTEDWLESGSEVTENYMEKIYNFIERGKHVRFQIQNVSGTPFDIEGLLIGFNDAKGITK